mmetsp:Transcript_17756/g.35451  ORF Transcript_17756/g.35451 Transcript_17756/m.35451 type:complete len:331 (+) Transcript_17756:749-1741(+)
MRAEGRRRHRRRCRGAVARLFPPAGAGPRRDVARVPPRAVRAVPRAPRGRRRRDLPLSVPAPPGAAGRRRAPLAAARLHGLPRTPLTRDPRVCPAGPLSRAAGALPPPAHRDTGPAPPLAGRRRPLLWRRGGAAARRRGPGHAGRGRVRPQRRGAVRGGGQGAGVRGDVGGARGAALPARRVPPAGVRRGVPVSHGGVPRGRRRRCGSARVPVLPRGRVSPGAAGRRPAGALLRGGRVLGAGGAGAPDGAGGAGGRNPADVQQLPEVRAVCAPVALLECADNRLSVCRKNKVLCRANLLKKSVHRFQRKWPPEQSEFKIFQPETRGAPGF